MQLSDKQETWIKAEKVIKIQSFNNSAIDWPGTYFTGPIKRDAEYGATITLEGEKYPTICHWETPRQRDEDLTLLKHAAH